MMYNRLILLTTAVMSLFSISLITSCQENDTQYYKNEVEKYAIEKEIPLIDFRYRDQKKDVVSDDIDTIFQMASLSKPLFAYIVLKMVDNEEIGLDTPIYEYTDIERMTNKEWAKFLTPRMVLSHRTGLVSWSTAPSFSGWPSQPINFIFSPDSTFGYSGESYAFLQRAVEKIRGKNLDEIAKEEVFIPFNMTKSSYGWLDIYDEIATNGHNSKGKSVGKGRHPRENAAYTLRSNVRDYSQFIERALIKGEGLKPETHKLMLSSAGNAKRYLHVERGCDKYIDWGLGVGIERNKELGEFYFHWGDNGEFKNLFIIVPEKKSYLIFLTNKSTGLAMIEPIVKLFYHTENDLFLTEWVKEPKNERADFYDTE